MSIKTYPSLGALPKEGGTEFRVWAPDKEGLEVVLEDGPSHKMTKDDEGYFSAVRPRYRRGHALPLPRRGRQPSSLTPLHAFNPRGFTGPSMVVDPGAYDLAR